MSTEVVHHIAFRISDDMSQAELLERLMSRGYLTSSVMERCYFKSIYFREPRGVLFEVATDSPGFTVDETEGSLGSSLSVFRRGLSHSVKRSPANFPL
jgi:glyoxalase family protein